MTAPPRIFDPMRDNKALDRYVSILTEARAKQPTEPLPDAVVDSIISTLLKAVALCPGRDVPLRSDATGPENVDVCSNSER